MEARHRGLTFLQQLRDSAEKDEATASIAAFALLYSPQKARYCHLT